MVKPLPRAGPPLIAGVLIFFLACSGLSLFCPMTADGHMGGDHSAAQAGHHCPDSVIASICSWEPAAVLLFCHETMPRPSQDFFATGHVETAPTDTAEPPRYLLLTTFRL